MTVDFSAMVDVLSVNAVSWQEHLYLYSQLKGKTGTSGIRLGVLLKQDEQTQQKTVMSNWSASSKMMYSQLTCIYTETLPDAEEFAFIACGDLQYSFFLLGGGCCCFHVCGPCARTGIFIQASQDIYTHGSLLCCPLCPLTSEKMHRFGCDGKDHKAKILLRIQAI